MATTPLSANSHGDHASHELPFGTLIAVLLLLMALMALTIGASYVTLPSIGPIPGIVINNLVAVGIATIKAALVIWFFMGVKFASTLARIWVVAGFLVLFLMFGIMGDYGTRKFEQVNGWETGVPHNGGETALPRVGPPEGQPSSTPEVGQGFRPR
jgi:cytochrome c oxidase subunit 4